VDVLTKAGVSGWAYDKDDPTKSIGILIRIDGNIVAQLTASANRGDLTPIIGSPNHAFAANFSGLAPGTHKVEIFAVDAATGVTTLLGAKSIVA